MGAVNEVGMCIELRIDGRNLHNLFSLRVKIMNG